MVATAIVDGAGANRSSRRFSQDVITVASTNDAAKLMINCKRADKVKLGESEACQLCDDAVENPQSRNGWKAI